MVTPVLPYEAEGGRRETEAAPSIVRLPASGFRLPA